MENLLAQIEEQMEQFKVNAENQISKGNKAAGTRARKAALEAARLMKEFRKASMEATK